MKLSDFSDSQFKAMYNRVNTEIIVNRIDEPKSVRERIKEVHERAKKLKMSRCARLSKDDTKKFLDEHSTSESFKSWVEKVEQEPLPVKEEKKPIKRKKKEPKEESKEEQK